jgi:lambda family phage portal protein
MSLATRILKSLFRRSAERQTRWPPSAAQWAPARQQLATRHQLSARAQYLIVNSPSAASIVDQWTTNLIGDGPSVRSGHPDEAVRRALEDGFSRWCERVDVEQQHDLCGFLNAGVRSLVQAGEMLVHLVTDARGELRLRLLSPEQLDPAMTREVENMQRIIAGVEFDAFGKIVAYHVYPAQPDLMVSPLWQPIRIAADDICHAFESRTPGQVRGTSWLASVATRLLQLDELEDALLARARSAAMFGAFVVDPTNSSGLGTGGSDPQELSIEPGTLRILPADATITFPQVPTAEGQPDLLRHMLRTVSAGAGIPYELLASDLSATNYSSAKLGLEAFKRRCGAIRETLIVARLLRPVWRRWVTLEILSGRLQAPFFEANPEPYLAVQFLWPQWESLNPYDEARADIALVNAGIRSRAEVISARGRDIADVDSELAADRFQPATPMVSAATQGQDNVTA